MFCVFFRTIEKEFIADQAVQDQDETIEKDNVNDVEEDIVPSSNKKLKVTNSCVDENDKSIANDITEETNENISEKSNSLIEEEMTVEVQDTTIVESEKLPITCDKQLNKVDSIPVVIDKPEIKESVSSVQKIIENESISNEDMDTTEETNRKLETPSEISEANQEENEEEILQLFQDVPKDNN